MDFRWVPSLFKPVSFYRRGDDPPATAESLTTFLVGFTLLFLGWLCFDAESEAERLQREIKEIKQEIVEKKHKLERWKYLEHLREEKERLEDSLINK